MLLASGSQSNENCMHGCMGIIIAVQQAKHAILKFYECNQERRKMFFRGGGGTIAGTHVYIHV